MVTESQSDALNMIKDYVAASGVVEIHIDVNTMDILINPTVTLAYDGSDQIITHTVTGTSKIHESAKTYTRTFTWTSGNLTGIGAWSEV